LFHRQQHKPNQQHKPELDTQGKSMKKYTFSLIIRNNKTKEVVKTTYILIAENDSVASTKTYEKFTTKHFTIQDCTILEVCEAKQNELPLPNPLPWKILKEKQDWQNKNMFVVHPNYIPKSKLNWDKIFCRQEVKDKAGNKSRTPNKKKKQLTREQAEMMLKVLQRMGGRQQ
jgi:hypothetical protein